MASIEEPPAVLEPEKKKPLKEKRKRKKSADKENKDSPIKMYTQPNLVRTKIYSTLPLYEEMRNKHSLKESDLYEEFKRYLLSTDDLVKNNFPMDSPENPGHVISRGKAFKPDPTSRTCSRCYETFHIKKDDYISDTRCHYHSARFDGSLYTCCKNSKSKGCKWAHYHVSSELDLDEQVFKRVDGKRQVREDQSNKVYALDCEMVFTTIGMEVTKVGVVDLEGKTIYQTFVLPEHPVLDYNTEFSGITANDLKGVDMTLADVQNVLLRILNKDTILVGHALQNDLRVLRLIHEKVVDTQVVFHKGNYKRKLKALALEHLKKSIQESKSGHDSIEDARACMELMLWKINLDFDSDKCPSRRKKLTLPENLVLPPFSPPKPRPTRVFVRYEEDLKQKPAPKPFFCSQCGRATTIMAQSCKFLTNKQTCLICLTRLLA